MQLVLPVLAVDLPAGQSAQASAAVPPDRLLNLPMAQSVQSASDVLPSWSLYFPAAQSVQTLEPWIQNVPAGQHAEVAIEPPPLTPTNIASFLAVLSTQEGPQRGA